MINESNQDEWGSDDEPDEDSTENAGDQLEDIDEQLLRAGHGGHLPQSGEGSIDDNELRRRIKDRVDDLMSDELEAPAEDIKKIRDFFTTIRIRGAEALSDQEIELLWTNVMRNPSLVVDFTFYITTRKTTNNYSEFPLLPDARDMMEFADDLKTDLQSLRPRMIRDGAQNLKILEVDDDYVADIMMGGKGDRPAEAMRMLGWLAGFPIMRGAKTGHRQHAEALGLEAMTMSSIAHTFIVMINEQITTIKERGDRAYMIQFKMDHAARERHNEVLNSLQGIQNLLYETFIDGKSKET